MKTNQNEHVRTRVVDLRNRLQDVKSLLYAVASTAAVKDKARDDLGVAISSIQAVSEDLASVCDETLGDPAEHTFMESQAQEARSEVESGEFDVHG